MESKQVYAYRAVCEHGKTRALVVDEPVVMKDCVQYITRWLKDGLRLERVTIEEARKSDIHCDACDEKFKSKKRSKAKQKDLFITA